MYRKLNLDRDKVDRCRDLAKRIIAPLRRFIDHHSSVSIERASLKLLGVAGERDGVPLAQRFVATLARDQLHSGPCLWLGRAMIMTNATPTEAAARFIGGGLSLTELEAIPRERACAVLAEHAAQGMRQLDEVRRAHVRRRERFINGRRPYKQLTIKVGSLEETVRRAGEAVVAGIDIVMLDRDPRSTMAEEIPPAYGKQLALVRAELDRHAERLGHQLRLAADGTGVAAPECALAGALTHVDIHTSDPFFATLFGDVDVKRAFVDQHAARLLLARAGLAITTRQDAMLTALDVYRQGHQALATIFLDEQLMTAAKLPPEAWGMMHAYGTLSGIEDGMLYELAHAQVMRELFPRSPIVYGCAGQDAGRAVLRHLVGMISEHTVHVVELHEREAVDKLFTAARDAGDELIVNPNGKISRRAHTVLENTFKFLERIEELGLMVALGKGVIADRVLDEKVGRGGDGVFQKERQYYNPVMELLEKSEGVIEGEERDVIAEVAVSARSAVEASPLAAAGETKKRRRRRGRRGGRRHRRSKTSHIVPQQGT